jgi:hypothetical protein
MALSWFGSACGCALVQQASEFAMGRPRHLLLFPACIDLPAWSPPAQFLAHISAVAVAAPSPRLQRCLDAAVAAGAPLNWLQEKYPSLRSKHMHQVSGSSSSNPSVGLFLCLAAEV